MKWLNLPSEEHYDIRTLALEVRWSAGHICRLPLAGAYEYLPYFMWEVKTLIKEIVNLAVASISAKLRPKPWS